MFKKLVLMLLFSVLSTIAYASAERYCNGQVRSDSWGTYYPNGQKTSDTWGVYYPSGKKIKDPWGTYFPNGQKVQDPWGEYYPNGQKIYDAWGVYYHNGQKTADSWGCYALDGSKLEDCNDTVRARLTVTDEIEMYYDLNIRSKKLVYIDFMERVANQNYSMAYQFDQTTGSVSNINAYCD